MLLDYYDRLKLMTALEAFHRTGDVCSNKLTRTILCPRVPLSPNEPAFLPFRTLDFPREIVTVKLWPLRCNRQIMTNYDRGARVLTNQSLSEGGL